MAISTTIKAIQDIMRKDAGVDGDAQRISQLGWMLFLKILDDREKEYELLREDFKSPIPEPLRWKNWATNPEGITGDDLLAFIDGKLFPTLKDLPVDAGSNGSGFVVKRVFEDSYNYMKNGHSSARWSTRSTISTSTAPRTATCSETSMRRS